MQSGPSVVGERALLGKWAGVGEHMDIKLVGEIHVVAHEQQGQFVMYSRYCPLE